MAVTLTLSLTLSLSLSLPLSLIHSLVANQAQALRLRGSLARLFACSRLRSEQASRFTTTPFSPLPCLASSPITASAFDRQNYQAATTHKVGHKPPHPFCSARLFVLSTNSVVPLTGSSYSYSCYSSCNVLQLAFMPTPSHPLVHHPVPPLVLSSTPIPQLYLLGTDPILRSALTIPDLNSGTRSTQPACLQPGCTDCVGLCPFACGSLH
ncbi:hypothetical protein EV126DRAFT_403620 [Verticillium dahliae]|nr:hypothetical protein EV126DRAFT_403620 [Verticillium dahliae]